MKIVILPKFLLFIILSAVCTVGFEATLGAGEKDEINQLKGCICEIDQTAKKLKVVPWNKDKEAWQFQAAQWYSYNERTKISSVKGDVVPIFPLIA